MSAVGEVQQPHPMNICLVSSEYPTDEHRGGIGTYTQKTARGLVNLGQHVSVITQSQGETSTKVEEGVTVIRLAPARRLPRLLTWAGSVARWLNALPMPPDIVQVCEYRAEGFRYALRRNTGAKLVTRLATPTYLVEQLNCEADGKGRRAGIIDRLERLQTQRSDAIISPTNALADLVSAKWDIPRGRVTTIRTGVDFAARYDGQAESALPAELCGRDYILYFGRLEQRKGVHILGQALPQILATHPELHVVFAGQIQEWRGQSLWSFIEQCNAEHIDRLHSYARLPQNQLAPLVRGALFVVLPSLWENLANTCLEALDMGKPVIATLGCGFAEVIEEGRSGLLVPPGDVLALRQAMLTLLENRQLLSAMSTGARLRARSFHLDEVSRDLLHFYHALTDNAGNGFSESANRRASVVR